jgi:hypothetical protein
VQLSQAIASIVRAAAEISLNLGCPSALVRQAVDLKPVADDVA